MFCNLDNDEGIKVYAILFSTLHRRFLAFSPGYF